MNATKEKSSSLQPDLLKEGKSRHLILSIKLAFPPDLQSQGL